jgi:hypothetical protein
MQGFYTEGVLATLPTPKQKVHPSLALREFLISTFAVILHFWGTERRGQLLELKLRIWEFLDLYICPETDHPD